MHETVGHYKKYQRRLAALIWLFTTVGFICLFVRSALHFNELQSNYDAHNDGMRQVGNISYAGISNFILIAAVAVMLYLAYCWLSYWSGRRRATRRRREQFARELRAGSNVRHLPPRRSTAS